MLDQIQLRNLLICKYRPNKAVSNDNINNSTWYDMICWKCRFLRRRLVLFCLFFQVMCGLRILNALHLKTGTISVTETSNIFWLVNIFSVRILSSLFLFYSDCSSVSRSMWHFLHFQDPIVIEQCTTTSIMLRTGQDLHSCDSLLIKDNISSMCTTFINIKQWFALNVLYAFTFRRKCSTSTYSRRIYVSIWILWHGVHFWLWWRHVSSVKSYGTESIRVFFSGLNHWNDTSKTMCR